MRTSFGLDGGPATTGSEAFEAVMERGNALALANGWRLARRRLMGGNRVEIEGRRTRTCARSGVWDAPSRSSPGARVVFVPGAGALEHILERWPLAA